MPTPFDSSGIFPRLAPTTQKFYTPPSFNYSVEVETILPSIEVRLIIPNGSFNYTPVFRTINTQNNIIKFDNIKLCCNDIGTSRFWIEVKVDLNKLNRSEVDRIVSQLDQRVYMTLERTDYEPIKSDVFIGPNVTNCILSAKYESLVSKGSYLDEYCMTMNGYTNRTVALMQQDSGTWRDADISTQKYNTSSRPQELCFSVPESLVPHEFAINSDRNK